MLSVAHKEISASVEFRAQVPVGVWNLVDYANWKGVVWQEMGDVLDERVRAKIGQKPVEHLVFGDFEWLDKLVSSVWRSNVNVREILARRLYRCFQRVRVAHATRAYDVATFYRDGLLPFETERFQKLARTFFLNPLFPELSAEMLENSMGMVVSKAREGRVFFDVDETVLTGYGGQYLHYGSEYLVSVAANLGRFRNYAQVLRSRGHPTVFVCDVPISQIDSHAITQLSGQALGCMMRELTLGRVEKTPLFSISLGIQGALPSEYIIGHYHPVDTPDPLAYLGCQGKSLPGVSCGADLRPISQGGGWAGISLQVAAAEPAGVSL